MAKSLIIVESPSKARTITKYLGKKYNVIASVGHVKDLPASKLGVDIENNFVPDYITIKGKAKVLTEIKKAAKSADAIFLAPDPDREGEAIAWHIAGEVSGDKVNAQQARRILDRIVGYKLSPLLWDKVRRGLSAGRVQSVAVRLICDLEREIEQFVS